MATPSARESCVVANKVVKKKKKRARGYHDPVAGQLEQRAPRGGGTPPESVDPPSSTPYPGTPQRTVAGGRGGGSDRSAVHQHQQQQLPPTTTTTEESLTMEELFEGTLTEETLRSVAGTPQLRDVTRLALVIDSSQTSVEGVWAAVPRLHTLTLDGSRLSSFRDLGVGLRNLNTLSLESSCVEDLDGIGALSGLRKLRLTRNRVSDVTPLACHSSLQVLGLECNRVSDMNALEILGTLPLLYSLDLRRNPLTESLGKLLDGRGRGVVHQLIPQLRILDDDHFSGGRSEATVDAQLLHEADDLICEGASRARAAWAEEDAAAEVAAESQWEQEGADRRSPGSASASSSRRRRRREVGGVAAAVGGGGSQQIPDRGMVHWDSDLTQGGRQALSGNPSSAIRRHKLGRDAGKRRNSHSPARVLETLDLAKLTEQGLKHRHNQAADRRVSEWRRETCSDSTPQEDVVVPAPVSAAPSKKKLLTPVVAPPSPSEPQSPGGGTSWGSPRGGPCDDRRGGGTERSGRRDRGGGSSGRWDDGGGGGGGGTKSPPMLASMSVSAVDAEQDMRNPLSMGRQASSGRPWTTGGGGGGGGGRHAPASALAAVAGGIPLKAPTSGIMSARTPLKAQEVGKDVAGEEGGDRHGDGRPRRQRPQTATERSRRRCGPPPEEPPRNNTTSSWQPVWESLKTARLVSPTVRKEETGEEGSSTQQVEARGELVRLRNVNFRCQRRARTARTRTRSAGGRDGCPRECDDDSMSAEEPGGSDESDDASYRNEVKRRASRFGTVSTTTTSDGVSCTPARSSTLPQCPPPTPEASIGNGGGGELPCHVSAQQKAGADETNLPPKKKATRKETATTMSSSRRSLAAMDGSSSEDEVCVRKPKPPPRKKSLQVSGDRCGVDSYGYGGAGAGGASSNGGASSGGDRSGSPARRVSSVHASRVLGFDLKKSLAAIDEWTDKATTASKDDSCGGSAAAAAAGREVTTTSSSSPPVPCFVQRPERPTPSASKTGSGREVALKGYRHDATSDATPTTIRSAAPKRFAQQTVALGACNNVPDEEDGSEEEGVISVAAARAALGISKVCPASTVLADPSGGRTPRPSWASSATAARGLARRPSPGEIDGLAVEGGYASTTPGGKSVGSSGISKRGEGKQVSPTSTSASPGVAVGMSDEALRCMLRRQPRTVPELRTKESFREFFQGMGEERMGRLLRGAYEGSLPADEVDRKVDKRLGLVADLLAR